MESNGRHMSSATFKRFKCPHSYIFLILGLVLIVRTELICCCVLLPQDRSLLADCVLTHMESNDSILMRKKL